MKVIDVSGRHGEYAGFASRAVALTIDLLVVTGMVTVVTLVGQLAVDFFRATQGTQTLFRIAMLGIGFLIPNLYFISFWMLAGQTLGKGIMGIRVVGVDGGRVHIGMAIRRAVGYYLSAIFFIGYLWVLVDKRRQGLHDKLAGTIVVFTWPEEELKGTFVMDTLREVRFRRHKAAPQDD